MWKAAIFVVLTVAASFYLNSQGPVEIPELPEKYWGKEGSKRSKEIRPFKIDVQKSVIDDLHHRLEITRPFINPLENTNWTYGIPGPYLETVMQYWHTKYDWTKRQALLNKHPQFLTNIQGLDIHFYHVKPSNLPKDRNLKVLPLLISHGWPGSTVEFQKIIPLLTTSRPDMDFVFEVIAPSIPGYGFSEAAVRPGLAPTQVSIIFKNLMLRLGFKEFYVQGGDWGSIITTNMAVLFPDHVIGVHSNMCFVPSPSTMLWTVLGSCFPSLIVEKEHASKMYPLSEHMSKLIEESGYMHIQATKPDTIGFALSHSPASLAAYLLEKFSTWTNNDFKQRPDGGLLEKFTLDELLDNIMMYWITNSITTSVRLYAEHFASDNRNLAVEYLPVEVPTACAAFPHELMYIPETIVRKKYKNLVQFSHPVRGGHFAAFEEPQLLSDDIFSFVNKVEKMMKKQVLKGETMKKHNKK